MKKTLIAFSCAMAVFLTACGDDDKISLPPIVVPAYYIDQAVYNKDTVQNASQVDVMRYYMQGVAGQQTQTSAIVLYPKTTKPQDGWRVVVWEHGTVGGGDSCAPSVNSLNPRFKSLAEDLLAKGYVIVAPDYEGLGAPGIHPYLNLKSAANSAIYAVKAFSELQGKDFEGSWVSVGQSQGGHASLATAEIAGKDTNYKAAVAAAPASSLEYIMGTILPEALNQVVVGESMGTVPVGLSKMLYSELLSYAALVGVGIKAYEPNFVYQNVFQGGAKKVAEQAEGTTGENGLCLNELIQAFSNDIDLWQQANPGRTTANYPGLIDNFEENISLSNFLSQNQPATKKIDVPVMIIQGKDDMAIPYFVTESLKNRLTEMGTDVTFLLVEDAGHTEAIVQRQAQLIAFIEKHMPAK
jgi:pimeloyl-ACP methyl ester carboxylesterase